MALTKDTTAEALQASASNAAAATTKSSAITIGYGSSIIASITNGGTAPTLPGTATLEVSADGTNYFATDDVRTAGLAVSTTYTFAFNLGVGGNNNGDWTDARISFSGNTAQAVTILANGSHTSGV